jgi:V/A-type H+/Na+-transporting ATPase subunit D
MAQQRVNPTRMELLRLKKRTTLAERGHKLLKEKRDGLMREFLSLVREVRELRKRVDDRLGGAQRHFILAQAAMNPQAVRLVINLSGQRLEVRARERNVMGVRVPLFDIRGGDGTSEATAYPQWETSPELDLAQALFREVLPDLLKLAALEKAAQLLAQEIEKTRRRVNALEHVLLPQLSQTTRYIRMKLEEQGRAAIVTTMKVKQAIE